MPRKQDTKYIRHCFYISDDKEDEDDTHGYHRLEDDTVTMTREVSNTSAATSCQRPGCTRQSSDNEHEANTNLDTERKRLDQKLRREKMRQRIGHVIHSTWKWLKRGAMAAIPNLASMCMFSPVPASMFSTSTSRSF